MNNDLLKIDGLLPGDANAANKNVRQKIGLALLIGGFVI